MNNQKINVNFIIDGKKISIKANEGDTILDLKHEYEDELGSLECACEGSLACSTCHVILDKEHYPFSFEDSESEPSCEESDMLDLAPHVTSTSRLGCQVRITRNLEDSVFTVPSENRNFSHTKAEE
jgi:ferredoxin